MNRQILFVFSVLLFFAALLFPIDSSFGLQRPNGVDGDPATDGGNGESGVDTYWHGTRTSEFSYLWIWGRTGYAGGHGGNGIDGSDSDSIAVGGNGGDGGSGGSIYVSQEGASLDLKHTYIAGNGGDSGAGGTSKNASNGRGGNGGAGGSVVAATSAINGLSMHANGGRGGIGLGFGQHAGDGGSVDLFGSTLADPSQSKLFQKQYMFGQAGNGGIGRSGASGGNGGHSNVQMQSVEMNRSQRDFIFESRGGTGGKSFGDDGGAGGNAELILPTLISDLDIGDLRGTGSYSAKALAGSGGASLLWFGNSGRAGDGGDAIIRQSGVSLNSLPYVGSVDIIAAGGDGGLNNIASGRQPNLSAIGGNGGDALVDGFKLNSIALPHRSTTMHLSVYGGVGGISSYGQGGDGGVAAILNSEFDFTHTANLSVLLNGGAGGTGYSGHDGSGGSVSLQADDLRIRSSGERLSATYEILGGTSNSVAGDARLEQQIGGEGNLYIIGKVRGGNSVLGTSGNSYASMTATTTGQSNIEVDIQSETTFYNTAAEIGGSSSGYASATTDAGNAVSNSQVKGGKGRTRSGTADSTAIAVSQTGNADATSFAQTVSTFDRFRPTDPINVRGSNATSTAIARGAIANVSSQAIAMGGGGMAKAFAILEGNSGTANLSTDAGLKELNHATHVEFLVASDGAISPLKMESFNSYGREYQTASTDANIHVASYIRGDESTLAGIENSVLNSQFNFGQGQYDLVQTLDYRSVNDDMGYSNQLQMASMFDLDYDLLGTRDVYAFVYDTESIAGGVDGLDFLLSVNGTTIVDETFATGDAAQQFLEGWSFNITQSSVESGFGNLNFDLQMTADSSAGQAFQFRLGIAYLESSTNGFALTAVPEPGNAGSIAMSILIFAVAFRRSRV